MTTFKPMLAAPVDDVGTLRFPLYISPKLDGIRCIIRDGVAYSRSNKPIRNKYVQSVIHRHARMLEGLDGELIVGSPTAPDVYRTTNSAVMSIEGEPNFSFYVFDWLDLLGTNVCFENRWIHLLTNRFELGNLEHNLYGKNKAILLPHYKIETPDELLHHEQNWLSQGYEGVMLRDPMGPYKQNRSTLKEGYLMKLKRFSDAEAECIGYGELMHNENEAQTNELGYTERSSAKDGLRPAGTLGYLLCRTPEGVEFKIGTGFTQNDRDLLWAARDTLPGRLVKYKYFEVGVKDAPRHPVWLGFRDEIDME